ncbi:MAG: hypothetical protein Q8936_23950, partial [Bacillota bacterium]|nr:hypothetical protein [Bacillota bacterium]
THIKNTNNQITQGMPTENPIIRETIIHELPIRETVVQGPPTREMNIQQPNIRNTTVDSYVPTNGQIMDQTIGRNDYIGINYDRYLQSNKANHSYANNIDSTLNASQNMEDRINEIVFRRGAGISYGKSEDKLINKFDLHGIDNTNAQLQHQIANHSKMYNVNDGADSQLKRMIRDYNEAANNGVATPSDKKHLEDRMTDAAQSILGVAGKDSELADFFKVIKDPEQFKKLPDALKRVYKDMRSEISGTADSITQMIKLIENMGLEIDKDIIEKLKKSKSELTSTDESISNTMSGNSDNSGSLIGNILGAAKGVWGGFGTAMGAIGLGNLVPTSLGSLARMTIGGAATEYRRWGAMDMSGAAAAMNQGYGAQNPGIMNNILASNQNIGLDWYRATHGMVDFNEYANNANTLLTGVQGHYGQGADKLSGVSDMYNLSRTTFDIGKVFGVSSPQMADITKSFYKELGQGAKETSDQLLKLAETAQAANIPVGEYLKTIASLSVKFKGMGVDVSLASIGMNNMINGYGMTETEAENFIGGASNMVSHMSSSTGETAYFGNLAGISSNPWTNMRSVRDRWSLKNGKVSVNNNATTDAFKMIDQELALYSKIGGANKDLQWNTVYDRMKTLGMQDDQSASIATNLYMKGDMKNLETFFDKQLAGTDSKQQSVKIDGQADLERRIETTADKMDSLTQAENSLRLMQATMGQELKGMFDLIGGSLQDNILNLNDTMATLVKSMQSNKMVQGVENLLEQLVKHPGWALLGLIAGKIVGNAAKSFIASSIVGGGAGAAALNGGKVVSKGAINALKRAAGSIDKEALGSAFKTVGNGILNGTEKVLSNPITKVAAPLAIAGGIIWSNSDKYAIGDDSMSGHFNRDLKKYYEHKKNGTLTAKDKKAYKDAMDFGKKAFGTSSSSYLPSDAINYKDNQYNLTFGKKDRLYRDEDGHITGTFDNKGNFVPFKVNNKKSLTKDNQLIRDIFASNIQKEVYDKKGNLDFSKLANYTSNHPNWHPEDVKNFKKELNKFKKTSSNSKSNGTGAMQDELIKINNAIVGAHGKNKNNTFYDSKLGK